MNSITSTSPQSLLPLLLSTAGRIFRIPLGEGEVAFMSIIRLLSAIVCDCSAAVDQLFEEPSNFYVLDLASVSASSLGISIAVQIGVCFFLGNCFAALEHSPEKEKEEKEGTRTIDSNKLTRTSFLNAIESKIGLPRFQELVRVPLNSKSSTISGDFNTIFFSPGFEEFYRKQVESIRSKIYEFYTGNSSVDFGSDSSLKVVLEMQKERILELERTLSSISGNIIENVVENLPRNIENTVVERGGEDVLGNNKEKEEILDSKNVPTDVLDLSARILDLESSLLESDKEIMALQKRLEESENNNGNKSENKNRNENRNDVGHENIYESNNDVMYENKNRNEMTNTSGDDNTKYSSNISNNILNSTQNPSPNQSKTLEQTQSKNQSVDMREIYPEETDNFGIYNPLGGNVFYRGNSTGSESGKYTCVRMCVYVLE